MVWEGVIAAAAAVSAAGWLAAKAWPRSAARRHLVLAAALAVCLLLPAAAAVRFGTGWTTLAVEAGGEVATAAVEPPRGVTCEVVDFVAADQADPSVALEQPAPPTGDVPLADDRPTAVAAPAEDVATGFDWVFWWRAAYAAVAGALLLRTAVGLATLARLKRRGAAVDVEADWPVLETDVAVPLAAGWGRPAVLLPRGYAASAGAEALADVVAHEAAHLRRRDHVVVLFQRLAAAAYWPAAPVHLMNRSLDLAREELCDGAAVRAASPAGRTAEDYGRTLLSVAERVTGRRSLPAPSVAGRGELERRVKALLDPARDPRAACGRGVRAAAACVAAAGLVLAGTARTVAAEPPDEAVEAPAAEPVESAAAIEWTGVPTVAVDEPDLHRGVVYGPDGRPLAGAAVHAASTIELYTLQSYEQALESGIGPVRAMTDAEGRFEFRAPDLTRTSRKDPGRIVRWETLLVATKAGLPPAFLETWGDDRGFREPWHPQKEMPVAVRFAGPATLRGRFLDENGRPWEGAEVRVTGLMTPVDYDLDKHIPQEEEDELTMFEPIDYRDAIYRPRLLPGLTLEATTDADGRFAIEGLPKDRLVRLEVRHPEAKTTELRAAVREMPPVYRRAWPSKTPGELQESPTLYGSGFEVALGEGVALSGTVRTPDGRPAAGLTVAVANRNAPGGYTGPTTSVDGEGRFSLTGFSEKTAWRGVRLALVGSFEVPYESTWVNAKTRGNNSFTVRPAVPYRLTLTDRDDRPVDRRVTSVVVRTEPGQTRRGLADRFDEADRVGPGEYQGVVPAGPGAVLVGRNRLTDEPAAIFSEVFFAKDKPGRDRAARNAWTIPVPAVDQGGLVAVAADPAIPQPDQAAIVLTNGETGGRLMQLEAKVLPAKPMLIRTEDPDGNPVEGVEVWRHDGVDRDADRPDRFSLIDDSNMVARREHLVFYEPGRRLIGAFAVGGAASVPPMEDSPDGPVRVVKMHPATVIRGRLVTADGEPDTGHRVRLLWAGGRVWEHTDAAVRRGRSPGEFEAVTFGGRGRYVGQIIPAGGDAATAEPLGVAFDETGLERGQLVEVGDVVVP